MEKRRLGPNSNIALVTCTSCALGNGTNLRAYLEFYWSRMDRLAGWPALNGWYITILVLDWIVGVFNNPTQLVINFFLKELHLAKKSKNFRLTQLSLYTHFLLQKKKKFVHAFLIPKKKKFVHVFGLVFYFFFNLFILFNYVRFFNTLFFKYNYTIFFLILIGNSIK